MDNDQTNVFEHSDWPNPVQAAWDFQFMRKARDPIKGGTFDAALYSERRR